MIRSAIKRAETLTSVVGPFTPPTPTPASQSLAPNVVALNLFSMSGAAVAPGTSTASPNFTFRHPFVPGDIPSGMIPVLTSVGQIVPFTPVARNLNKNTDNSLGEVDFVCQLPVTVPATASLPIEITYKAGTWASLEALPGSATIASIIADYVANHDDYAVELDNVTNSSGVVSGSGTWQASLKGALALGQGYTSGGGYMVMAQGPTLLQVEAIQKYFDPNNGNAQHASLARLFYANFHLNPMTGTVLFVEAQAANIQGRANITSDRYTYQSKTKLGNNVCRTFGFSTDEAGSCAPSFASSSINTSTGQINIGANGFNMGDLVFWATTGTPPTGISTTTPYFIYWDKANPTLPRLSTSADAIDGSTFVTFSNQGTGTHSLINRTNHLYASMIIDARADGLWDRWAGLGNSSFAALPPIRFEHDIDYCRRTGRMPPFDTFTQPVSPATQGSPPALVGGSNIYRPGTLGTMTWNIDADGADQHLGMYTHWAARAACMRSDWTGYVKTARIQALMNGTLPVHWVASDATWRVPVCNNGHANSGASYPGLAAPQPVMWYQGNGANNVTPNQNGGVSALSGPPGTSHWPDAVAGVHLFEGGPMLRRILIGEAAYPLMWTPYGNTFGNGRAQVTSTGYHAYTIIFQQPRGDAWSMLCVAHALQSLTNDTGLAGNLTSEWSYFSDIEEDCFIKMLDYVSAPASHATSGLWPGPSNNTEVVDFMQWFIGMTFALIATSWASPNALAFAQYLAQYINASCALAAVPAWYSTFYRIAVRLTPGSTPNAGANDYFGPSQLGAWQPSNNININSDGTTFSQSGVGATYTFQIQPNDRVWFTDTDIADETLSGGPFPATGLAKYTKYYARQINNAAGTFKVSTTPDDTGILTGVTPTTGIGWFYGGFGSSATPSITFGGSSTNYIQGYLVILVCAAMMLNRIGLVSSTALANAQAVLAAQTPDPSTPAMYPGFFTTNVTDLWDQFLATSTVGSSGGVDSREFLSWANSGNKNGKQSTDQLVWQSNGSGPNSDFAKYYSDNPSDPFSIPSFPGDLIPYSSGAYIRKANGAPGSEYAYWGGGHVDSDWDGLVVLSMRRGRWIKGDDCGVWSKTGRDPVYPFLSGGTTFNGQATATVSGNVMTVTSFAGGTEIQLSVGVAILDGASVTTPTFAPGTTITSFGTGTGGNGTYNITPAQTITTPTAIQWGIYNHRRIRPDGSVLMTIGTQHNYSEVTDMPEIGGIFMMGLAANFTQVDRISKRWISTTKGFNGNLTDATHDGTIGGAGNQTNKWLPSVLRIFASYTNGANSDQGGISINPQDGSYQHFTNDAGVGAPSGPGCVIPDPFHPGHFAYICAGVNYPPGNSTYPNGAMLCWTRIDVFPPVDHFPQRIQFGDLWPMGGGTGTLASGVLTVSGATGTPITVGMGIVIPAISSGSNSAVCVVTSFGTGTGGNGTYNVTPINTTAFSGQGLQWGVATNSRWDYIGDAYPGVNKVIAWTQGSGAYILDLTAWISSGGVTAPTWNPISGTGLLPTAYADGIWNLLFECIDHTARGKWFCYIDGASNGNNVYAIRVPDSAW